MLRAAVSLLLVLAGAAGPALAQAPAAARTVLVLSSERSDLPSVPDFDRGLRQGLAGPDLSLIHI